MGCTTGGWKGTLTRPHSAPLYFPEHNALEDPCIHFPQSFTLKQSYSPIGAGHWCRAKGSDRWGQRVTSAWRLMPAGMHAEDAWLHSINAAAQLPALDTSLLGEAVNQLAPQGSLMLEQMLVRVLVVAMLMMRVLVVRVLVLVSVGMLMGHFCIFSLLLLSSRSAKSCLGNATQRQDITHSPCSWCKFRR